MKEALRNSPIACAFFTLMWIGITYGAFIDGSKIFAIVSAIFSLIWFGDLINCLRGDNREYKEIINRIKEENEKLKAENDMIKKEYDTIKKESVGGEEKKDDLLFEVAEWAIECGNGLSTAAVQRHFSISYSRACKIVDQLYSLHVCSGAPPSGPCRSMLIDMDKLLQLERSGAFNGT
jgi:hypothetical protein